ncbi:Ankyrin-2 [Trapelia coarctata]|nr:Ankyrin-2 [Trapelia coarctata]
MDPLSVSASIAGLITLAEVIVSRGYEFLKGVKHAKAEISQLLAEITALFGVLQSLRLVADRFQGEGLSSSVQVNFLQTCHDLVDRIRLHLKEALPEDSDGRWRAAGKSLRWPLPVAETRSLIDDVERHKTALSLALNADGLNTLLDVLGQQEALRHVQGAIQDTVNHVREEAEAQRLRDEIKAIQMERENLLKDWTAINPEIQHSSAIRLRHPGTGEWFLDGEDFKSCLESHNPALWLYGIAGAGKTVLASAIIETIRARVAGDSSKGIAYFYCDYKDSTTQEPTNIMRSLLKHAAVQHPGSFKELQQFIGKHKQQGDLDSIPNPTQLKDLLLKVIRHYDSLYIVVDALDECPDEHRHAVLDILGSLRASAANVTLIYTSREEVDIAQALSDFKHVRIAANVSDLELYAASEIELRIRSGRLRIKHTEIKDEIIDKLSHGADGMFRWVACQLDYLCELTSDKARCLALKRLPPTLFATYERILERIISHGEDVQAIVERTLRWTLGGRRRLIMEELIEAISVDVGDTSLDKYAKVEEIDVLRWCSSLIRKTADGTGVELAHFTVEEFLKAINPAAMSSLSRFAFLKERADIVLGQTCLTYLTLEDFTKVGIEACFWQSMNPFWEYAAVLWHEHCAENWNDEQTRSILQNFFHPSIKHQFVIWNRYKRFECLRRELQQTDSISPIHHAAALGLGGLTQWLISQGCDSNKVGTMGTPLECALSSRHHHREEGLLLAVSSLLESKADVSTISRKHSSKTPLALAIESKNLDLIGILLKAGATVDPSCLEMLEDSFFARKPILPAFLGLISDGNVPESLRKTLIDLALSFYDFSGEALTLLEQSPVYFREDNEMQERTLLDAALRGQLNIVSRTLPFLTKSIDVSGKEDARTALHLACMNGHYDIACFLLSHGANANRQDTEGDTPGHLCIRENYDLKTLERLIDYGADPSLVNSKLENYLHLAAQGSRPDALQFLVTVDRTGELRRAKTEDGSSILLCALKSSLASMEMVDIAASPFSSAECLLGNNEGETGLHLAAKISNLQLIKFFLDKGNLNEKTKNGSTALHYAVEENRLDPTCISLLLSRGADATLARDDGQTALHLLSSLGDVQSFTIVLAAPEMESTANLRDCSGSAAIHILTRQQWYSSVGLQKLEKLLEHPMTNWPLIHLVTSAAWELYDNDDILKAVQLVLDKGADVDLVDGDGLTALHHLCKGEITPYKARIIHILLEKGSNPSIQSREGQSAVELLMFRCELLNKWQRPSTTELELYLVLLKSLSDQELNSLNRGFSRPLVLALRIGAKKLVTELVRRTTDVNESFALDYAAYSPLEASCVYSCDFEIFRSLASRCENLMKRNAVGNTLLHLACAFNRKEIVNYLLALKPDLEVENADGSTALNLSGIHGSPDITEALLDAGADPAHCNRNGFNLWHATASSASLEPLQRLCQRSKIIRLEDRTSLGHTPLLSAVAAGGTATVEKLLALGSDIHAIDNQASGVLHVAATYGKTEVINLLLKKASELDVEALDSNGNTPLLVAAANGHQSSVVALLDSGSDPYVTNERHLTLLHYAAWTDNWILLNSLKIREVTLDLEATLDLGRTALFFAVEKGNIMMAGKLLDLGARVDSADAEGWNALHVAAYLGHDSVMELLLKHGFKLDINVQLPSGGSSPLGIAVYGGHLAVVETLLTKGADLLQTDTGGWNTIHLAAANTRLTVLRALLSHCEAKTIALDINARDKSGKTALMLAESNCSKPLGRKVVELLKRRGAKSLEPWPEKPGGETIGGFVDTKNEVGGLALTAEEVDLARQFIAARREQLAKEKTEDATNGAGAEGEKTQTGG